MIHWRILLEEEQVTECPMERERESMTEVETIRERIPWDPDPSKVDYNRVLLDHFFPSEKQRYLMTSFVDSQRTHTMATHGR